MVRRVSALVTVRLAIDLRSLSMLMSRSLNSLRQHLAFGESATGVFSELENAIESTLHISRELLALGPHSTGAAAAVNVNDLVARLESDLRRVLGPDVRVALRLDATDPLVHAEAAQLQWILLNLAAISRDGMRNGGDFAIRTVSADRQVGTPPRTRRFLHLTITDNGEGLFGDGRARPFESSFANGENGMALGLTTVATIVRNYQGWLHIEGSTHGTSIHIHFPTL